MFFKSELVYYFFQLAWDDCGSLIKKFLQIYSGLERCVQ